MSGPSSATAAVGTLLNGTYRLERVIAQGGMGVVYEAAHVRLPRRFAVKVLGKPIDSRAAATGLARFRREAEIASSLGHPHIVEVFDYQVSEGGAAYLVMELLEGEDLADRLRARGRLSTVTALRIIAEVAQALDVAHEAGVVHRDLKPANIFLSQRAGRDDFVKVLDFGVSKLVDAATLTHEKAMVGTPLYMSPEQALGTQELTPVSDVFSLGSIAFEMLTGRRAFGASSIPSILYQIVHGPTPTVEGLGPEADAVFARGLAKDKAARYLRASEFAEALARALGRGAPIVEPDGDAVEQIVVSVDARASAELAVGGETAAATAVDASTHADEDVALAPSLSPSLIGPRRRSWRLAAVALAALAALAAGVVLRSGRRPEIKPILIETKSIPAAPPSEPKKEIKAPEIAPAPPTSVQFTFHVVPSDAVVTVDDLRVHSGQITLPWQTRVRRVRVTAPRHHPLLLTVPSTANRAFELHLERSRSNERAAPPPHGAAPVQVQDL